MTEGLSELRSRFEQARSEGLKRINAAEDLTALEEARVRILGRKSDLSQVRMGLKDVPHEERAAMGKLANDVQADLEAAMAAQQERFEDAERALRWERDRLDVTLPGDPLPQGHMHVLTKSLWEIIDVFLGLGYSVAEGPDVEYSRLNFDALNTPYEHPSRSASDTFYVAGKGEDVCLRTQTSPMQVRAMEAVQPPLYIVSPGRVYRRDALDATHINQFFQMEGLAVDEGLTMADLKGTLEVFAHKIFGEDLEVRLRPHFFPFTEPSAEMDVQCFRCKGKGCRLCKQEGWIEILGCGMVDPNVFAGVNYDNERYTGFAFGLGIERIAALSHGIEDIRLLYGNDLRFGSSFRGIA